VVQPFTSSSSSSSASSTGSTGGAVISSDSSSGLSHGAIAGIVVGSVVGGCLILALLLLLLCRRNQPKGESATEGVNPSKVAGTSSRMGGASTESSQMQSRHNETEVELSQV